MANPGAFHTSHNSTTWPPPHAIRECLIIPGYLVHLPLNIGPQRVDTHLSGPGVVDTYLPANNVCDVLLNGAYNIE
jgi:hypothetical protein